MAYLSVSTWSLHRLLGPLRWTAWDAASRTHVTSEQPQPEQLTLLDLPVEAARRGFAAVEICHFHFPSTDPAYAAALRAQFAAADIAFDTLLLDYGDLTSEDDERVEADLALMRQWIRTASLAGAKRIRIIAGDAPPDDEAAIRRAAGHLNALSRFAAPLGVQVVSENFRDLTSTGASCAKLLAQTEPEVGFITDFGNFHGPDKYEQFAAILPRSLSVHAKAHYDAEGLPDEPEFRRCLEASKASGFDGAYVLIYDGPGDMWQGLARIRNIVGDYI